ncbi:hypothetical protein BDV11DRAFT_121268 [Aspergillus similis]
MNGLIGPLAHCKAGRSARAISSCSTCILPCFIVVILCEKDRCATPMKDPGSLGPCS